MRDLQGAGFMHGDSLVTYPVIAIRFTPSGKFSHTFASSGAWKPCATVVRRRFVRRGFGSDPPVLSGRFGVWGECRGRPSVQKIKIVGGE